MEKRIELIIENDGVKTMNMWGIEDFTELRNYLRIALCRAGIEETQITNLIKTANKLGNYILFGTNESGEAN